VFNRLAIQTLFNELRFLFRFKNNVICLCASRKFLSYQLTGQLLLHLLYLLFENEFGLSLFLKFDSEVINHALVLVLGRYQIVYFLLILLDLKF
jgi:hypothetical protein